MQMSVILIVNLTGSGIPSGRMFPERIKYKWNTLRFWEVAAHRLRPQIEYKGKGVWVGGSCAPAFPPTAFWSLDKWESCHGPELCLPACLPDFLWWTIISQLGIKTDLFSLKLLLRTEKTINTIAWPLGNGALPGLSYPHTQQLLATLSPYLSSLKQ